MTPKKPRPVGRLGQINKRARLVRRALNQWKAQEQREAATTRLEMAVAEWEIP
jgi:hypothetical protein